MGAHARECHVRGRRLGRGRSGTVHRAHQRDVLAHDGLHPSATDVRVEGDRSDGVHGGVVDEVGRDEVHDVETVRIGDLRLIHDHPRLGNVDEAHMDEARDVHPLELLRRQLVQAALARARVEAHKAAVGSEERRPHGSVRRGHHRPAQASLDPSASGLAVAAARPAAADSKRSTQSDARAGHMEGSRASDARAGHMETTVGSERHGDLLGHTRRRTVGATARWQRHLHDCGRAVLHHPTVVLVVDRHHRRRRFTLVQGAAASTARGLRVVHSVTLRLSRAPRSVRCWRS
jgi:hypothetical protein